MLVDCFHCARVGTGRIDLFHVCFDAVKGHHERGVGKSDDAGCGSEVPGRYLFVRS